MHIIDITDLSKCFQGVASVSHVTLHLEDATLIRGPSGSGKTTLLRLIAGLEVPDCGEIRIGNALVAGPGHSTPPAERGVSFMFQSPALWPHMTVRENIRFGILDLDRSRADRRISGLLSSLSLTGLEERYPSQLSGGESRRVALARALAPVRPVLLLDEPFQNLNPELKARMQDAIRAHLDESGALLILVSHDGGDLLGKKTVWMDRGTVRAVG